MDRAIGSAYEISLRIMLLLEITGNTRLTADMLSAIDFITVYGNDFGVLSENLHGNGDYRFGEFALRRKLVRQSVKTLVLDDLISVKSEKNGFTYNLNKRGEEYASQFICEYSDDYRISVEIIFDAIHSKSEDELINLISRKSISSLKRSMING